MSAAPERTLRELGEVLPIEREGVVRATPYRCVAPESIPARRFLFASRHAIAGHTSATGAFGGTGKSSLLITEALAHCTARNLLQDGPLFRGKAWLLELEDPLEEHQRRIAAAMLLHNIRPEDIEGRFFVDTAEQSFVLARDGRDGLTIAEPIVEGIIGRIREHGITFLTVDPFVACHAVSENDNGSIDIVARLWGRIARETGCAIELVHHLRKGSNGGGGGGDPSVDDFRGASSLIPAVRSARLLTTMTKDEAEKHGVDEPFRFIRVIDGKKNMGPRSSKAVWRELVAMDLRNGDPSDHVAAVGPWQPPDAIDAANVEDIEVIKVRVRAGRWRESDKATDWVGNVVAEVLRLDLRDQSARRHVKAAIASWLLQGVLRKVDGKDSKGMTRTFVEAPE